MVRIISEHGLRAVPVDIDPETLAPLPCMLQAALTPRTRIVLVAHLFGGRMDLGVVAKFARERGLFLVEDCAQAFQGPEMIEIRRQTSPSTVSAPPRPRPRLAARSCGHATEGCLVGCVGSRPHIPLRAGAGI